MTHRIGDMVIPFWTNGAPLYPNTLSIEPLGRVHGPGLVLDVRWQGGSEMVRVAADGIVGWSEAGEWSAT